MLKNAKFIPIIICCVFVFGFASMALAQGQAPAAAPLVDAGLLPDSQFYFLKTWKEKIQLFFSLSAESKATQFMHLAEVRLAEYQKMMEKGKTDIAKQTFEKYERQLDSAFEKTSEARVNGKDVTALAEKLQQERSKHAEVLEQTAEAAPQAAKEQIIEDRNQKWMEFIKAVRKKYPEMIPESVESTSSLPMALILRCSIPAIPSPESCQAQWMFRETSGCPQFVCPDDNKRPVAEPPRRAEETSPVSDEGVCAQVITPAINPETQKCQEFPTPCDVPTGWGRTNKCPEPAAASPVKETSLVKPVAPTPITKPPVSSPPIAVVPAPPSHPAVPVEPVPTEIRYYTCPDGTKVESGKCYNKEDGSLGWCSIVSSPELKCPAPTPPVTAGGACATQGETKYYDCPSGGRAAWCKCGPESGAVGAKNVWRCQHLPELYCPKSAPAVSPDYISCQKGGTKNHQCSGGTEVMWQCQCLNIVPEATAYWGWKCELGPTRYCPASSASVGPAITRIEIRHYGRSIQIFWDTNIPTLTHMEYGPTTAYGSRAGGLSSAGGSLTEPGTQFVVEGQHLSIGTSDESKLRPDTLYHFRIIAADTNGNKFVSQDYTFSTVPWGILMTK